MIIDNPEVLKDVIDEAKPRETCRGGAFRLVNDLQPRLLSYASQWEKTFRAGVAREIRSALSQAARGCARLE